MNTIDPDRASEKYKRMLDFNNWTEVSRGYYRYVIAAGACYEIMVWYCLAGDNILTAKASLYLTGDWTPTDRNDGRAYFSRECLLDEQPVFECLERVVQFDKTEMGEG